MDDVHGSHGFTAPGNFKLHLPEGDLRPRARTCQAVNESILAGVLREEQLEQPYTPLLPTFPAARGVGAQRKASGGSAVAHNCFGVAVATTQGLFSDTHILTSINSYYLVLTFDFGL